MLVSGGFFPSLKVMNCTFSDNSAQVGGGMYNYISMLIVTNCTFSGNTANEESGGGMGNYHSYPMVVNCTFSGNTANKEGGGMYNYDHNSVAVVNCTFSGNLAHNAGGGMYSVESDATLVNTILWGNTAMKDSASSDILQDKRTITLKNCVVGTYSLTNEATESTTNLIQTDPKLKALDKAGQPAATAADVHIYELQKGSSAINQGLDVSTDIRDYYIQFPTGVPVPDTDQRGVPRPNDHVDIGAFEAADD